MKVAVFQDDGDTVSTYTEEAPVHFLCGCGVARNPAELPYKRKKWRCSTCGFSVILV